MSLRDWFRGGRVERRDASYTDSLTTALLQVAGGGRLADPTQTAAAAIAALLYSSALASGDWAPDGILRSALDRRYMAMLGRDLVLRGEAVAEIVVSMDGLRLRPASSWTILGTGTDPGEWTYQLWFNGPSGARRSAFLPAAAVLHFRRGEVSRAPWRGVSPLASAGLSARALAEVEGMIGDEASGARGYVLPVPANPDPDDEDDPLAELRRDMGGLRGQLTVTETTAGGWGEGRIAAPTTDYKPVRIGGAWPQQVEQTRAGIMPTVLSAAGIPPSLADPRSDGTSKRESYRFFLHATVQPLAEVIAEEAAAKLDVPGAALTFTRLSAGDVAGRARSVRSLVDAGVDLGRALTLAGVE